MLHVSEVMNLDIDVRSPVDASADLRVLEAQLQDDDRLERACQHILAAYKQVSPVYVRSTAAARRVNWFVHRLRYVKWVAIMILVALSVYERPVWCLKKEMVDGKYACDSELYPGWGHKYLSLVTAFSWEAACLCLLSLLEVGHIFAGKASFFNMVVVAASRACADEPSRHPAMFEGGASYTRPTKNKINLVLLSVAWIDMVIAIITPATFFRLGPLVRICILANKSSRIRRELYLLAKIIPGLASLLLLTVLNLAFFAFFGLVLFHDIAGAEQYFGTFGRAMWQLWVLQTTSNFPDVRQSAIEPLSNRVVLYTSDYTSTSSTRADHDGSLRGGQGIIHLFPGFHTAVNFFHDESVYSCSLLQVHIPGRPI